MTKEEIKKIIADNEPVLKSRFKVDRIEIYGSYVQGEENYNSDVDILVDIKGSIGWDFFELQDFLEEKIGKKVDLVTTRALKPQIRDYILNEVTYA